MKKQVETKHLIYFVILVVMFVSGASNLFNLIGIESLFETIWRGIGLVVVAIGILFLWSNYDFKKILKDEEMQR